MPDSVDPRSIPVTDLQFREIKILHTRLHMRNEADKFINANLDLPHTAVENIRFCYLPMLFLHSCWQRSVLPVRSTHSHPPNAYRSGYSISGMISGVSWNEFTFSFRAGYRAIISRGNRMWKCYYDSPVKGMQSRSTVIGHARTDFHLQEVTQITLTDKHS